MCNKYHQGYELEYSYCCNSSTSATCTCSWSHHSTQCKPCCLAEEMGVSFFDNSEQFLLHNKEVNDGYLFDQVHLNIKGSNKLAQSMGLTSNTSDPLDISSIYATQTKPSTWTNRSLKYVAPGLRLKTGDSTPSHEEARHGQRGTAGTPVTSLPTPMSATRGPQSEAQGRRTEQSKRSVTQSDDIDFNSPFWNKTRS